MLQEIHDLNLRYPLEEDGEFVAGMEALIGKFLVDNMRGVVLVGGLPIQLIMLRGNEEEWEAFDLPVLMSPLRESPIVVYGRHGPLSFEPFLEEGVE